MVSKACDSQLSSSWSAALIPPCAALECERTGWTLLMMPTETPCSAAASAARCPARPAPITKTSWSGTRRSYKDGSCGRSAGWRLQIRVSTARSDRAQRLSDRVDRENAADAAVGVGGDQGAEAAERLVAEHGLERLVLHDREGSTVPGEDVADDRGGPLDRRDVVGGTSIHQPDEALCRVDDGKPGGAVAQEVFVQRLLDGGALGDGHRVAIHHVADGDPLDPAGHLGLGDCALGGAAQDEADEREPDAAEKVALVRHEVAEAGEDQEQAEPLAERRGEPGPGGATAGPPPGDRAGDAAAVERERGDQVEDQDQQVDAAQPADQRRGPRGARVSLGEGGVLELVAAGQQQSRHRAGDDDRSRDDRPRDRD